MNSAPRWLFVLGLALIVLAGLLWLAGRWGLHLGRLPGDFTFQRGGLTCMVPLASGLLLSVILTLLLNLAIRYFNR